MGECINTLNATDSITGWYEGIGSEAGGGQKRDQRTPDMFLRAVPIPDDRIQLLTVDIGQPDRDTREHAPDSHVGEIPFRT